MLPTSHPGRRRAAAIALALSVSLAACGGDDDASPDDAADQPAAAAEDADDATSAGAPSAGAGSDLVVPLDYLQGEWCNSDGEAWAFDGETARFGENHDELFGELPTATAFAAGSQRVLVSQSDDEFVLDLQAREVTFTRGRC